jgi:hypothetical protein
MIGRVAREEEEEEEEEERLYDTVEPPQRQICTRLPPLELNVQSPQSAAGTERSTHQ